MAVKGARLANNIYLEEFNELSGKEKTDLITANMIREYRGKGKAVLPNVNDSFDGILLGMHECDVLNITEHLYGMEYEIKISKSDILADLKKKHKHKHHLIKRTYFVVPSDLVRYAKDNVPEHFGIIEFSIGPRYYFHEVRKAQQNKSAKKWSETQILEIYKKAYQRYLTIKQRG